MRVLVTAGPTREAIDPVRFISNGSSGKMGYGLARAALDAGHEVVLVSGPVALEPPAEARTIEVVSANAMLEAVRAELPSCDTLIMVAAVSDWRPRHASAEKLKKSEMSDRLELERTPDILSEVSDLKGERLFVGFAAETEDLLVEAERKLRDKNLDYIVANDVSHPEWGMESEFNKVVLIGADGSRESMPVLPKLEVARLLIERIEAARAACTSGS